jgi:hypothetical protein
MGVVVMVRTRIEERREGAPTAYTTKRGQYLKEKYRRKTIEGNWSLTLIDLESIVDGSVDGEGDGISSRKL